MQNCLYVIMSQAKAVPIAAKALNAGESIDRKPFVFILCKAKEKVWENKSPFNQRSYSV